MKIRKILHLFLLLAGSVSLVVMSCEKKEEITPPDNINKKMQGDTSLSLLSAAITRFRLDNFTDAPGPFTILAPTNDAFKKIGITDIGAVSGIDTSVLIAVLTNHILNGKRINIEIPAGPNAPITSIQGSTLYAARYSNATFFNGARVVEKDIEVSNGVIHKVNRVIIPPILGNIINTLSANSNYKLLIQALNKAGLTTTLSGTGPFTLFAPNNTAFIQSNLDSAAIANSSGASLTNLTNRLRYHVFQGRLFSSEVKPGNLKTLQGSNLIFSINNGLTLHGSANTGPSSFLATEVGASSGVFHPIDSLLRY